MCDLVLAKRYLSKAANAKARGIPFDLPMLSYVNLMKAKRCKYTGLLLTSPRIGKALRGTDRTVERLDSNRGYVKGNVVAICHAANQFKSTWENPNSTLTAAHVRAIVMASQWR